MKRKLLIITGMLFCILSFCRAALTVDLGGAQFQSGYYTFPDATVTEGVAGDKGYVIRFMFTRAVSSGDVITLPALPAGLPIGWTEQTSISTQYVRVVAAPSSSSGATAAQLQAFLRQVQVKFDSGKQGQGVTVLISDNVADAGRSIFYSSDTEHYYEYVAHGGIYWSAAYNAALDKRFMGLKGYLATITSEEEQTLLASIASNNQGWIGGTRAKLKWATDGSGKLDLSGGGNTAGILSSTTSDNYWYWAAGPEWDATKDASHPSGNPEGAIFYGKVRYNSTGTEISSLPLTYSYNKWSTNEPNNASTEYVAHLLSAGPWNDYYNYNTACNGYLVEYYQGELEGPSSSTTVGFNCTKTAQVGGTVNAGTAGSPVTVYYGDEITYTIHATNASEDNPAVTVTDVVQAGLDVIEPSISNGGTYNSSTRTVTWSLTLTANGGNTDVTFKAKPSVAGGGDAAALTLSNSATVHCINKGNPMTITTNSTYHQVKRAKVTFAVDEPAAATLTVTHNPWTVDYARTLGNANVDATVTANPGYTFNSWSYPAYTDLKSASRPGSSDASYSDFTVYGDMTVTANFDTIVYDINYTLNDGTNNGSNPAQYHVKTPTITLQTPTRAGYHFDGWESAGSAVTEIQQGSTGNVDLTAKWTEITVDQIPNDTICNGDAIPAITFTSAGQTYVDSYNWSVNNHTLLGLSNSSGNVSAGSPLTFAGPTSNPGATPLTDTITVTPKEGANAGTPMKFAVTVNPTPTVDAVPNDTVCHGATVPQINFTTPVSGAVPAVTYSWVRTGDNVGFAATSGTSDNIPSFTANNTGTSPLTATITVTPHINGCAGTPESFTITVNPTPTVNPVPNDTVCHNGTVATKNFGTTVTNATVVYKWKATNHTLLGLTSATGTGSMTFGAATNSSLSPRTDTVTVTPYIEGFNDCPGTPATFLITVNPTPTVNAVPNDTVCNGATVPQINFSTQITGAVPAVTYTWTSTGAGIGLAVSGSDNIPSFTAANTGVTPATATITVMPHINGCAGTQQTFTITVNPTAKVNPVPNDTVCNGGATAAINFGSPTAGATPIRYKWEKINNLTEFPVNGAGNIPAQNLTNSTSTFLRDSIVVTPYFEGFESCPGTKDTFLVIVNPTPRVIPTTDTAICHGGSTAAIAFGSTVTGASPLRYKWTNLNNSTGLSSGGYDNINATALTNSTVGALRDSIVVTPYFEGFESCSGPKDTFHITINPKAHVIPTPNDTVCNGATVAPKTFGTNVSPNLTVKYKWKATSHTLLGLTDGSGEGNISFNLAASNTGTSPRTDTVTVTPYIDGFDGCPGTTDTFLITVNPTPTIKPTSDTTICNGVTLTPTAFGTTVTDATVIYKWKVSNPALLGLSAPGTGEGNITFGSAANPGFTPVKDTVTVTPYIDGFDGCPGATDTFIVTVNPAPQVIPTADTTVCNDGTLPPKTFNTTVTGATVTYKWKVTNHTRYGLSQETGTGNIPFTSASNTGTAPRTDTVTVTPFIDGFAGSCPGVTDTFLITVNPTPTIIPTLNDTVCHNATVSLKTFNTTVTDATVIYKWKATNHSQLGLDAATGTGNITFTHPATNGGTSPRTDTVTVTPYISGFDGCPGATDTFLITVNPAPQVYDPADTTVCHNVSVDLPVFTTPVTGTTPPVTYTWANSGADIGIGAASGSGDISTFTPANTGNTPLKAIITVTPHIGGCDGTPVMFNITVNPAPQVNDPADTTVCKGATVTLPGFTTPVTGTTPAVTYTWVNSNTGIGLAANGSGNLPPFIAANAGNTPLTATVTVTPHIGGCDGTPKMFDITVNPAPQVYDPADTTVCSGVPVTLPVFTTPVTGTTPPVTYTWTNSNTVIGLAASGSGNIPSFNSVNTGNAPLTATITVTPHIGSCDGQSETFTVKVNPAPTVYPTPNDTVCTGETVPAKTFGTSVTGVGVIYKWKATNHSQLGLGAATGEGSISFTNPATNGGTSPRTDTVFVTPHIAGFDVCPGTTDTFLITVNPRATVNAIADVVYYDGQSVAPLTAVTPTTPATDVTFSWTNSNPSIGLPASGVGATIPAFTALNSTASPIIATITVTPKFKGCAGTQEQFTITVRPKPTITYHYNGGTPPASPNPTNYVVGVGCTVNNEPTRLGYPFAGWTCPELGISSTSPAPFIVPTTATADLNLQANWSAATPYNITYITNGGSTPLSASSYTVATPDITLDAPIKAGHTFIGWTGTDIAGPFPQRDVIIPQGSTGDRAYNAHWSFQFAADTVYACNPPVALQSGHDGQSYLWTLPDGSTHTGADIQAHTTGKYILATDYGALSVITKDTVFVLFSFDGDLKIKRISEAGTKINLPQTFTVPLNPEIVAVADNIDWEWSFPGGSPLTSTADDTVSVAYAATGPKTVSVRIRIERSGQICEQTYTYDFEIHASVRGLFVDCHVAGGTEDGSSWPNAFRTIQEALADASEGDFIWVARGDYRAEAGQSFVLTRDSVEIYGGFAATETYLHERSYASNPTTVRGNGSSVIYTEGVSSASRWDGFIVEGGEAAKGGGITNKNSSVTIANTIIRGNTADHGGGIFSDGGSPVLYNVEISGNTSVDGGGMYNLASAPQLTHVTIAGNYAASSGGGICNRNGSNPALRNTIVWGNRSTAGPGVGNDGASVPYIASSLVEGSRAGGAWNAAVGTDGGNNLDASPGFRKKGFDDDGHMQQGAYRLYSFSPAIDRGANKYAFYTPIRLNVHLQTQQDTATVSAITGNDLAGYARMENDVVDMGAYEYFAEYDTDGKEIVREVAIPRVEGITTMPPAGRHFIQSQRDFVFTIIPNPDYSLDNLSVTTGIPLRDREGIVMERNEDGSITVIIRQVTEPISLTIQGATPTSADADAEHDRVWSHGKYLYVRADHDAELQIRTPAGILYTNRKVAAGDTAIMLPQGFYIVTLDGKMYKVVIK